MKALVLTAVLAVALADGASSDVAAVRRNLDKYWLYRNIQRTDFVEPGIGQGRSMPAAWRNPTTTTIKWSDGTIDLGWYIGALATEHYMLSHPELFPGYASGNSSALSQVRDELYHALAAMDRLDAVAEAAFSPTAPDTPGFFIRDDVPATFYAYFPGMTVALSDYAHTANTYDKEMSQDQVVHVLLGLTLVKKLIPPDLVVNGMNLRQAAIDRGAAIVDWVHHDGWWIKNPVTGNNVQRGPDARSFGKGFNRTVVYLTDGAVDFSGSISWFHDWVWGTLSDPANPAHDNRNNVHMAMSLAATGSGWGESTLDSLMSLAAKHKWYAYVLLYAALFDPYPQQRPTWPGHQQTVNGLVQTMLDNAPATQTPHYPTSANDLNTGWCGSRRFIVPLDWQNNGDISGSAGEWYPGLDYLVLHNLFYIVTPSMWQDPSPPGQATGPTPGNGAAGAGIASTTLNWTAGDGATSHDVYFGTPNPPPFRQNQTATSFGPGMLNYNTTYYWRIDEKNAGGTTAGAIWRFTTVAPFPPVVISESRFDSGPGGWIASTWRAGTTNGHGTMAWADGCMQATGSGVTDNADRCLREGGETAKTIPTTGYVGIRVQYDLKANGLGGNHVGAGTGSCAVDHDMIDEQMTVFHSADGGSNWTEAEYLRRGGLLDGYQSYVTRTIDLSGVSLCNNNPNFALRFRWQFNQATDAGRLDNIRVTGYPMYFGPLQAKMLPNGAPLVLTTGVVSAVFADSFYVQCVDAVHGLGGIKVVGAASGLVTGQSVTVEGTVRLDPATGERYVSATSVR